MVTLMLDSGRPGVRAETAWGEDLDHIVLLYYCYHTE